MQTHTKGPENGRLPVVGDVVEVRPDPVASVGGPRRWLRAVVEDVGELSFLADVEGTPFGRAFGEEGAGWRWPEAGAVQSAAGEGFVCDCGARVPEGVAVCDACAGLNEAAGEVPVICMPSDAVPFPGEGFCACGSPLEVGDLVCRDCRAFLRPDLEPQAAQARLDAVSEVPPRSVPEIRHCAAPAADDEPCGAVLGRDLYCTVCAGTRCYGHCGGVDHLGGQLISQGGSGRVEWRMRRVGSAGLIQSEYYAGQVTTEGAGGKVISRTFRSIESETCMKRVLSHVDQLLAAADGVPAYVPPEARQLPPNSDEVQALLGLHAMQSDLDRKVEDLRHSMLRIRRAVIDAAFGWYERQREEWKLAPALQGMDPAQREACRQMHERQVTDLFARIGGAL